MSMNRAPCAGRVAVAPLVRPQPSRAAVRCHARVDRRTALISGGAALSAGVVPASEALDINIDSKEWEAVGALSTCFASSCLRFVCAHCCKNYSVPTRAALFGTRMRNQS